MLRAIYEDTDEAWMTAFMAGRKGSLSNDTFLFIG